MIDPNDDRTLDIVDFVSNVKTSEKTQIVGYVRVSTEEQNIDRQLDGLKLDKIFIDRISGSTKERPELQRMIEYVRYGDTVVVHSLDRLARSLEDLIAIIKVLNEKGVIFKSYKDNLTFDGVKNSPMDKFLLHILGAVAELERALIRERQKEGIAKAKARGVYKGRKPLLTTEKKKQIDELIEQKNSSLEQYKSITHQDIAQAVGVSLPTLYRYLKINKDKRNKNS